MPWIFEASGKRGASVSDVASPDRQFIAVGYTSEPAVHSAFITYLSDQGLLNIGATIANAASYHELDGIDNVWEINCSWSTFREKEPTPASNDFASCVPEFGFSFALSSEKIVQPVRPQTVITKPGPWLVPDIALIGDQGDGKAPAGVDILVPEISFSEKRYLKASYWTESVRNNFLRMIGKVCNTPFRSFDAGEVLCAGISGAGRGRDDLELQFAYRVRENTTVEVDGFDPFDKLGWQYLWPRHFLKTQGAENIVTQEIQYLVLADVYYEADFSILE